jgi:hypothetical protein
LPAFKTADKHREERHKQNRPADEAPSFRGKRVEVSQGPLEPEKKNCKSVRSALADLKKVPFWEPLDPVNQDF